MYTINQRIAETLVELRGDKSQAEVADAIGVSPSSISMYESGERIPRDEIKCRIANYYKKPVGKIFFTKDSQIVK